MQMCYTIMQCDVTKSWEYRGNYWRGVSGAVFSVGETQNLTFLTFEMFYMRRDIKTLTEWKKTPPKKSQVSFKISSFLSEETPC